MSGLIRSVSQRLSYANVVATLALFMALGGTAYAAATIGSADVINNSLRSVDIQDETLTAADLRSGSVGTEELKTGGVRTSDIANAVVTSAKIRNGTIKMIDLSADARAVKVHEFDLSVPKPATVGEDRRTLMTSGSLAIEVTCVQPFDLPPYAIIGFPRPDVSATLASLDGNTWLPAYDAAASDHSIAAIFLTSETARFVLSSSEEDRALQVMLRATADASLCTFDGTVIEFHG